MPQAQLTTAGSRAPDMATDDTSNVQMLLFFPNCVVLEAPRDDFLTFSKYCLVGIGDIRSVQNLH